MKQVDSKEAIKMIDNLVFSREGRHLEEAEEVVLEAAWLDLDYRSVAKNTAYDLDLLQRRVAPKLWVLLTGILGTGEKVTKKRLRTILEQSMTTPAPDPLSESDRAALSPCQPSNTPVQFRGEQIPDASNFYGRTAELASLKELIAKQRCVTLIGAAGIGKSTLAAKLLEDNEINPRPDFDCVVWKSLQHAPLLDELVTELIWLLVPPSQPKTDLPAYTQAKVSILLKYLQSWRCLVVLDAAEAVLKGDRNNNFNPYGDQYAEYGLFFRRLVEEQHQSCLLLTSREPFSDLNLLQSTRRPVWTLKIEGLDPQAALQFLHFQGLTDRDDCNELIETYRGNPLELQAVANRINRFFGGNTKLFFEYKTILVSAHSQAMLNQLFGQRGLLSELQRQILINLAEELSKHPDPISFSKLLSNLSQNQKVVVSTSELIVALEALEERFLIERSEDSVTKQANFTLQPVVKKYILTDPLGLVRNSDSTTKSA